ncbi:hypothetical protein QBC43DRAFT_310023 [Cladorrhinum sp. PSN259]|nr:hypothetical protein QBC43DRAFT_310023 [Cladorrhinum sp. PSN259]
MKRRRLPVSPSPRLAVFPLMTDVACCLGGVTGCVAFPGSLAMEPSITTGGVEIPPQLTSRHERLEPARPRTALNVLECRPLNRWRRPL